MNSVMPMNMCSLKIMLTSTICSAALPLKVMMYCAQVISFTISWPSMWPADTIMEESPSSSVSRIQISRTLSPVEVTARMRALVRRRYSSIPRPSRHSEPMMPPAVMASPCLKLWGTPRASHTATGVSRPTMCPKNRPMMPTWKKMFPQRIVPV